MLKFIICLTLSLRDSELRMYLLVWFPEFMLNCNFPLKISNAMKSLSSKGLTLKEEQIAIKIQRNVNVLLQIVIKNKDT